MDAVNNAVVTPQYECSCTMRTSYAPVHTFKALYVKEEKEAEREAFYSVAYCCNMRSFFSLPLSYY
jgi:hypothetical protein